MEKSYFLDLAKRRRSCRRYLAQPLTADQIVTLLEAARLAPSACNKQPWRLVAVTDAGIRRRLADEALLPGFGMQWAADAPLIIVLGMEKSIITHKLAPSISGVDYPLLDLGIAGEHIVLQAADMGLGSCWIGWIRPKQVRKIVDWPTSIEPVSLITIGWPAQQPDARPRKPLQEIAKFIGEGLRESGNEPHSD